MLSEDIFLITEDLNLSNEFSALKTCWQDKLLLKSHRLKDYEWYSFNRCDFERSTINIYDVILDSNSIIYCISYS